MSKFKPVTNFQKLKETLAEEKIKPKANSYNNPVIFKPTLIEGQTEPTEFRIRFLPMEESSTGKPWMQLNYHMFERSGDGKFIKVIDPRTFDKNAANPIADLAYKLWKSENPYDKERAKKLFKKQRFFFLVYVKEAPANQQEFVGKVLIFEGGQKIYEKLENSIKHGKCFWDPYKGQDFLLSIKKRDKWPDYSGSEWIGDSGPIVDDEKLMDKVCDDLSKLNIKQQIIDKEGVKSGAELSELLNGGSNSTPVAKDKSEPTKDLIQEVKREKAVSNVVPDFGTDSVATPTKKVEPTTSKKSTPVAASTEEDFNIDDLDLGTDIE